MHVQTWRRIDFDHPDILRGLLAWALQKDVRLVAHMCGLAAPSLKPFVLRRFARGGYLDDIGGRAANLG
jgi:hypothetical protein